MRRFSHFWRCWQSGPSCHVSRPRARHRSASRLETLERRWNLSAVLVVETVGAYWLIEDPTFDSLGPTASADTLHGESQSANPGHDEIEMGLPIDIAPEAASGEALSAAESDIAWTLLNDLWNSEPDFFYEDVLAITFFPDTTIDVLIDSGMFDDNSDTASFRNSQCLTSDFLSNTDVFGASGNDFLDFTPQSSSESAKFISQSDNLSAEDFVADETKTTDVIAAAKAEVASWSQRLDAQIFTLPGAAPATTEESAMAAVLPTRAVVRSNPTFELATRKDIETVARDAPVAKLAEVAQPTINPAVSTNETQSLDSFFSRFPSVLENSSGRSSKLRLVDGEPVSAAENSNEAPADGQDASASWSYSQWTSLVGVAGLSAASLWKSDVTESVDKHSTLTLRAKPNGKRPVAL